MVRLYIDPTPLARVVLTDLRPAHVARWYDDMIAARRQANCSVGLVPAKTYRLLHAALEDAVRDQLMPTNPCMVPGGGKESSPERPLVTPEQVAQLAGTIAPRWSALVLCAAWGALRFGELQRLERRDFNPLKGTLEIRQAKTKAGVRTVHLPPQLVGVLARRTAAAIVRSVRPSIARVHGHRLPVSRIGLRLASLFVGAW